MVVLDDGQSLPEGAEVDVSVRIPTAKRSSLSEMLLKHAGTVDGMPEDLAQQHDHYLYGTPKR